MFAPKMAALIAASTMFGMINANCIMANGMKPEAAEAQWPESMCVKQAEGNYHLSYSISGICVPTMNGANAMAGCTDNGGFQLFDWNCKLLGSYDPGDEGNDCGVPYQIDYFPGKPIVIDNVWLDYAKTSYHFKYDGLDYTTKSNGACNNYAKGLSGVGECRVSFAGPGPCTLENVMSSPSAFITHDPTLCTTQDEGNYYVTMETVDPPSISIYDHECRNVAFYRREAAPDYCPGLIKINYFGDDKKILISKLDAKERAFSFDYRDGTYESGFEKTQNDVAAGLGEYASKSSVYAL